MIGRKSIIGLCMLCALAISAFAAQGASAALGGTTAFTCKKVTKAPNTKGFSKAHCKKADAVITEAQYEHFAIANDTTTELTGSNELTPEEGVKNTKLHVTIGGVVLTLQATEVSGTGSMHNHFVVEKNEKGEIINEEHQATGTGTITYKGVTVLGHAECTVRNEKEGVIGDVTTKGLSASTKGQGMKLKFEPTAGAGNPFATFWVEGAGCPITGEQKVFGSVVSLEINGATTEFEAADTTAQNTLKYGAPTGPKAGIDGLLTLKARANSGEEYTPLSATTTGEG